MPTRRRPPWPPFPAARSPWRARPPAASAVRAAYCGRYAPSPTGPLHFGSLVAALASYCDARASRGEWVLRIDDVDSPRTDRDAVEGILRILARYGFAHDGTVARQSGRIAHYDGALTQLRACGRVFACTCTRRSFAHAPRGIGGEHVYPGTCRDHAAPDEGPYAWRFRVDAATVRFDDRLQGLREQRLDRDVGDFVVKRSDGLFAYQLAVVVDDADQGVTHIVRGADLLSSTPRQIALQRALGIARPSYLHVPVAVDTTGAKLSKQTQAPPLPDDPLPMLLKAWGFLAQSAPSPRPRTVPAFWEWATREWNPGRLPRETALPAS